MNKKTIIILLSLIPIFIILISTFSSELSGLILKKNQISKFEIPLEENSDNYDALSHDVLQEYINQKLYVSNYDAKITITPKKNYYILDDNLMFKIKILDTGIISFTKPFFYIILKDPEDKIRACFPSCSYDSRKEYFTFWKMTSRPASSSSGHYNLKEEIMPLKKNDSLFGFYRESLIKGEGVYKFESNSKLHTSKDTVEYYFSFPLDEVGDWDIVVFVFDEEYYNREGGILFQSSYREDNNDLINYAKNIIDVKGQVEKVENETSNWQLFLKILAAFIGSILTFFAVFIPLNKYYDIVIEVLKKVYKEKQYWIGLIIILLIFLIMQYFIMR